MEMKVWVHVYFIVSMTTINKKCPQALFPTTTSSLLHFSNLQTMQCMEVKLGTHVYLSVSMMTIFPTTTSSLLKLAHHTMHGGKTWYTCVFQSFHDVHEQKMASGTFSYNYLFTSQTCTTMQCMEVKLGTYVCLSVSMTTIDKKFASGTYSYNYFFTSQTCTHHNMHGGETWYAWVFECLHDNKLTKIASGTFSYNYFFAFQTCKTCNASK